jgi:S1-C subfamily serine protease
METNAGLVIVRLAEDGPAAKAGLQGVRVVTRRQGGVQYNMIDRSQADRILAVDGEVMRTGVRFRDKIWEKRPGETVTLTIIRQGRQLEVPVTLAGD